MVEITSLWGFREICSASCNLHNLKTRTFSLSPTPMLMLLLHISSYSSPINSSSPPRPHRTWGLAHPRCAQTNFFWPRRDVKCPSKIQNKLDTRCSACQLAVWSWLKLPSNVGGMGLLMSSSVARRDQDKGPSRKMHPSQIRRLMFVHSQPAL